MINGISAVGPCAGVPPSNVYTGIPITVIRWDAETFDATVPWYLTSGFNKYFPATGKFNFRKPSLWNNGQVYGSGVNTAQIVDKELAVAKNCIDAWAFDWYKPAALLDPPDRVQSSDIMLYHDAYQASAIRHACGVKFCYMIQWNQYNYLSGKYITAFNTWFNTKLADPMYQLVDGKRLVILFNDTGASGWAGNLTKWNNFKTAVGGNIFGVSVNSVSMLTNLGLQAIVVYGPNSALPSTPGEDPWSAQATRDTNTWGAVPGAQKAISLTPVQDRRPSSPTTRYVDLPSRPQLVSHFANGLAVSGATFAYVYAGSEITEGGSPYDAGIYDVSGWARGVKIKPQVYEYELDLHSAAGAGTNRIILTGSGWSYQFPDPNGIQGACHNDEMWTSTAGNSFEITHDALVGFDIIGSRGAGLGTASIEVDNVNVGSINFSGSSSVRQVLFSYSFTDDPPIAHKIKGICDGTGQIKPDSIKLRYKP